MLYVGDFLPGQQVTVPWSTNSKLGASVSRTTPGTILVFRASTGASSAVGVTDNADVNGLAGIDFCSILLANAFYAPYDDYSVVLTGAVIDGDQVNAVLGEFSIMNRSHSRLMVAGTVDISQFPATAIEFELSDVTVEAANNNLAGRCVYGSIGNALIKQVGVVESSSLTPGGKGHIVVPAGAPLTAPFLNAARVVFV